MTRKQLEDLGVSKEQADSIMRINEDDIENAKSASVAETENLQAEIEGLKVDHAVEKALTGARARNVKAVKALLDLSDAKLDKEGNVKGLQEQIDKLVAADDTKFLFKPQQAKLKGFQPGASVQQKPGTEVDMSKMSYEEIAAYMDSNPDAQI